MRSRFLFLVVAFFSNLALGAFTGDWAAGDLYSFIGVKQGATTGEIIASFSEGADELAAAERAGLNVHARQRALINVRNILVEEHSRSVYNAYMEACRVDKIDPGTADQQQQMMAEYLRKHGGVTIASHRELFPKFHKQRPATKYAATDFTLHPLSVSEVAEVATPLVEPEPAKDTADCGVRLSTYRRLIFVLVAVGTLTCVSPNCELNQTRFSEMGPLAESSVPTTVEESPALPRGG